MKRMKQVRSFDDALTRDQKMQITDRAPGNYPPYYPNGPLWMMDPEIGGRINRR